MLPLTLALSKGRILEESLTLLAKANIIPTEDITNSRKLIFTTTNPHINLALIRATDIPTYIAYGAADIGITGKDVLLEYSGINNWYESLDLNIACCRLMTAKLIDEPPITGSLKVATKFANITQAFYDQRGERVEIIKLYGSLELAPTMGLAHQIVDIVDSGKTLAANHMQPLELIHDISSRLIVNKVSMKIHCQIVTDLITQLTKFIA